MPQTPIDFPAGSTWIAFTDCVSHAAMAGQFRLEQTFLLPVDAMLQPRAIAAADSRAHQTAAARLADVQPNHSRDVDRIYLDCVHGEGFLVDFYRRQGFQTIDRRQVEFTTGLFDMVLMERQIAAWSR